MSNDTLLLIDRTVLNNLYANCFIDYKTDFLFNIIQQTIADEVSNNKIILNVSITPENIVKFKKLFPMVPEWCLYYK